jgi:hypothetical protein
MAKHCNCERPTGRSAAAFAATIEELVNDARRPLIFLMEVTEEEDLGDGQKIGALFDILRALSSLECVAGDVRDFGIGVSPERSPAASDKRPNGHASEVQP